MAAAHTEARRVPFVLRPRVRRRVGLAMQFIAVVGVVGAVAGTIAAWRLAGRVDGTVGESLELTGEALLTLDRTITVAEDALADVDDTLTVAETTLDGVADSIDDSTAILESVAELSTSVAPSVEAAATTLDEVAAVGRTIDGVLAQLDSLPFGPSYDPEVPLGEQLDQLGRDIAPIGRSLRDAGRDVEAFGEATGRLDDDLAELADAIGAVNQDLRRSEQLLREYEATTARAVELIDAASNDLDDDVTSTRLLIVVIGVAVALGQIVPFWVGKELALSAGDAST